MPLYFAYGSNMDVAAMADRCPRSTPLALARLHNHRFFVTADGYASVRREPQAVVHGLLWTLALSDVRALDRYEELDKGLYAKSIRAVVRPGHANRALVYVGRSEEAGLPKPGYMEAVAAAAEAAGFPAAALADLRRWLPRPQAAGRLRARITGRTATG